MCFIVPTGFPFESIHYNFEVLDHMTTVWFAVVTVEAVLYEAIGRVNLFDYEVSIHSLGGSEDDKVVVRCEEFQKFGHVWSDFQFFVIG